MKEYVIEGSVVRINILHEVKDWLSQIGVKAGVFYPFHHRGRNIYVDVSADYTVRCLRANLDDIAYIAHEEGLDLVLYDNHWNHLYNRIGFCQEFRDWKSFPKTFLVNAHETNPTIEGRIPSEYQNFIVRRFSIDEDQEGISSTADSITGLIQRDLTGLPLD